MKITIEILSSYYEGEWIDEDGDCIPPSENKVYEVLRKAYADRSWFAGDMAIFVAAELNEMAREGNMRQVSRLDKCYDL